MKHNSEMLFDPLEPDLKEEDFVKEDQTHSIYGNGEEQKSSNAQDPRGFGFQIWAYLDLDHAGHAVTRQSRTGFWYI